MPCRDTGTNGSTGAVVSLARVVSSSRAPAQATSAATRESAATPHRRLSQPMPPPSVNPAIPVEDTRPPVTASPNCWVSMSRSRQTQPPCAMARRPDASTRITAPDRQGRWTEPRSPRANSATVASPICLILVAVPT